MERNSKVLKILKKHKITIVSVLAFAVAFGCIFAFAGNESGENSGFISEVIDYFSSEPEVEVSETIEGNGYGFYLDGNFIAAVSDKSSAEIALDIILKKELNSLQLDLPATHTINNTVEFVPGEYENESFKNCEELVSLLSGKVTDWTGAELAINIAVRSVISSCETVVLEYKTKTVYTDALRDGATAVVNKGYNGEAEETTEFVYVDGFLVGRNVVSLEVTTPVVDEVIRVGSRTDGKNIATLGTFIKPYDGKVTSYCGPRWGREHNGIDIAGNGKNCNGDPAMAAADGVVVRADWYGGYGNCVIIDHGDGVQTLYAHLSKITVSVGDELSAGDEVGKIGSTGNSTGPHLHFEVRVDGEIVNPLIFVDYD